MQDTNFPVCNVINQMGAKRHKHKRLAYDMTETLLLERLVPRQK